MSQGLIFSGLFRTLRVDVGACGSRSTGEWMRFNRSENMKKITAIIKPFKLDEVKSALTDLGITGMTVRDVRGYGRQKGHTELYRGAEYVVDFMPKTEISTVVTADLVDDAIQAIKTAANTDKIGDGKIFVTNVERVVRIRTGEEDSDALS